MKQYIYRSLICGLLLYIPSLVYASINPSNLDENSTFFLSSKSIQPVEITATGNKVNLKNAKGNTLEIYDLTGRKVFSEVIDSNDQMIRVNLHKGCYIFRIGKIARKIMIP